MARIVTKSTYNSRPGASALQDGRAEQRAHAIDAATAASSGSAGKADSDAAKRAVKNGPSK